MAQETDIVQSTGDVFRDLGFDANEAQDLRLRSDLMIALRQQIAARNESQAQIATLLGVSQPRVSDLLRGKIHLFSLDTLVMMLARFGVTVDVSVRAPVAPFVPSQVSDALFAFPRCFTTTIVGVGGVGAFVLDYLLNTNTAAVATTLIDVSSESIDLTILTSSL